MNKEIQIHWFRQDLRCSDNPGLRHAPDVPVLPIYILDTKHTGTHPRGTASKVWLHHSLNKLNQSLDNHLCLYVGDPQTIIADLLARYSIHSITWNRCYEPAHIERDKALKAWLAEQSIEAKTFNSSLLWEPWEVSKQDGSPYKVFTPFYRKGCLQSQPPRQPIESCERLTVTDEANTTTLDDLQLRPNHPWVSTLEANCEIGEAAAHDKLDNFLNDHLAHYKTDRNFPATNHASGLSPHLHFGEISPHQVWHAAQQCEPDANQDHFLSELGWREFSYYLLYHFPSLPTDNLKPQFDNFPWLDNPEHLKSWQQGQTGIPMVDAGMRQLWQTGIMHNRVRMLTASLLVKNLLIDWRHGANWFWDCLVDADLANNSAGWQWVAGCGTDAAPYFRIFNPATQGEKFDPDGDYIRHYVPEIADLPTQYLFAPWKAPGEVLKARGITLGKTYPEPVVDIKASRQRALEALEAIKKSH